MPKILRNDPYSLFITAVALIAVGVGLYTTYPLGAGVSGDAAKNLAVAANLMAGKGFFEYNLEPLLWWPPLYPLIIAGLSVITKLDVFIVGWYLNIFLLGLNIWLAGKWFQRVFSEDIILAYLATLTVAFSLSFFRISINIASDPLFFTFIILFFLVLEAYLQTKNQKYLWLAAFITALAGLQRYVGVIFIPVFIIVELAYKLNNFAKSLKHIVIFSVTSAFPLMAWIVFHNYLTYGTFSGNRDVSKFIPYENLLDSTRKIINWYFPFRSLSKIVDGTFLVGFLSVAIILCLIILLLLNKGERLHKFIENIKKPGVMPALVFWVLYQSFLLLSVNTEDHSNIWSDRYQLGCFFSLTILIGLIIKDLVIPNIKLSKRMANSIMVIVFVIWAAMPLYKLYEYVRVTKIKGDTTYNIYNLSQIASARVVENAKQLVKENPNAVIFSNWGGALWFYTRRPIYALPRYDGSVSLDALRSRTPAYIVWFIPNENDYVYSPDELSQFFNIEVVTADRDGLIYLVPSTK